MQRDSRRAMNMPLSSPRSLLDPMKPRRVRRLATSDHPSIISNDDKNISNLEHQMEQLNVHDNAQDVCTAKAGTRIEACQYKVVIDRTRDIPPTHKCESKRDRAGEGEG